MSTTTKPLPDTAPAPTTGRFDRLGIPRPLAPGFLGVLLTMTGVGVESNVVAPPRTAAGGSSAGCS